MINRGKQQSGIAQRLCTLFFHPSHEHSTLNLERRKMEKETTPTIIIMIDSTIFSLISLIALSSTCIAYGSFLFGILHSVVSEID